MQKLSDVIEGARLSGRYLVESQFMDGSDLRFLTKGGIELCPIEVALLEIGFRKTPWSLAGSVFRWSNNFIKAERIFGVPSEVLATAMDLSDCPRANDGVAYLRSKGY